MFSLQHNIIIMVAFVSLILTGCETTQIQTKSNTVITPQTTENILKKNKIEIEKTIEDPISEPTSESIVESKTKILRVGIMLPLIGGDSTVEISCGFTVLSRSIEEHNIGIIFGLDIMVSYGVSLNFSERTMIINGYTIPFMKVDEVSQIKN